MTDISENTWKELDADNTSNPPAGLPPGTDANKMYPVVHAMMGATKREYTQSNPVYTSTGTAESRVYNLTFTGGIQTPAPIGKTIKFNPNFSNVAGVHSLNINGQVYSLKRANGTSDLIAGDIQVGYPVEITCLSNGQFNLQNSINIDDNRLPTTLAGKTFFSAVTVSAGGVLVTGNSTITGKLNITDGATIVGSTTVDGQRVLTLADVGSGKGLDADKLDGQEGTFYLSRANHTGTQPVSTITGLDTVLTAKVSKAGDTMTGNLVLSNGSNPTPITFNAANGSITAGGLVHIQSSGTNASVLEMRAPANASAIIDFSPNGYGGDFVWRINAHPDTASFDIIHTGTHRFRLRNDGAIWNSYSGWLHDKFADRGAQIQHNSGVWEFGSIDPNYNDRTTDAPNPWVLVGLRSARGTNVINMRAIWLRNN
ncbi:hypothetical protein CFBP4996_15385 [Agrobacterium leguminum]|uniref:Uncharacterized protein n=1 Tax=Agrobacterium deltaense NCPPB 1641 TaxID=1183425 RepID=A0A1S7U2U3_9HYPH|nr:MULTISPECIES: hypothetical protein [Agrobacterium]WFS67410.1 hypothetical protein CFBP4996_15385 [Agrobacterium leguminum]CVI61000.1 hypothetical protein AGR7A_Lc140055 [Agrobacterium deltaense NCPPB 1641]